MHIGHKSKSCNGEGVGVIRVGKVVIFIHPNCWISFSNCIFAGVSTSKLILKSPPIITVYLFSLAKIKIDSRKENKNILEVSVLKAVSTLCLSRFDEITEIELHSLY